MHLPTRTPPKPPHPSAAPFCLPASGASGVRRQWDQNRTQCWRQQRPNGWVLANGRGRQPAVSGRQGPQNIQGVGIRLSSSASMAAASYPMQLPAPLLPACDMHSGVGATAAAAHMTGRGPPVQQRVDGGSIVHDATARLAPPAPGRGLPVGRRLPAPTRCSRQLCSRAPCWLGWLRCSSRRRRTCTGAVSVSRFCA